MCNSSVRLFHISIFMFHTHHIIGTSKNFYSSNISGFSSCNHYCNNCGYPFSSTVLDLILNFQTSRMSITICIYNWYMFLTAAFSSKSYIIPFWNWCLIWHFVHCLMLEVFHKTEHPLFFIVSHLKLKQTSSDFMVCWYEEIFRFWCLVVNSSKVWVTFCTFFSLVPNQEALVLLHRKTREMAHQVTKLAVSQQTPLCQKILLNSMTRWTKRMRMMMKKQFSRLSHLKWIRSVAVPLFFACCAHCCLWTLLYIVLHCQFNLSKHVV